MKRAIAIMLICFYWITPCFAQGKDIYNLGPIDYFGENEKKAKLTSDKERKDSESLEISKKLDKIILLLNEQIHLLKEQNKLFSNLDLEGRGRLSGNAQPQD